MNHNLNADLFLNKYTKRLLLAKTMNSEHVVYCVQRPRFDLPDHVDHLEALESCVWNIICVFMSLMHAPVLIVDKWSLHVIPQIKKESKRLDILLWIPLSVQGFCII